MFRRILHSIHRREHIPADKVIPWSALLGRRAKEEASQWIMFSVKNEVLDVLSDSTAKTQIMVLGKETLEEFQEAAVFN